MNTQNFVNSEYVFRKYGHARVCSTFHSTRINGDDTDLIFELQDKSLYPITLDSLLYFMIQTMEEKFGEDDNENGQLFCIGKTTTFSIQKKQDGSGYETMNFIFNDTISTEDTLEEFGDDISAEAVYNRTAADESVTAVIQGFPLNKNGLHMQMKLRDGRQFTTFLGDTDYDVLSLIANGALGKYPPVLDLNWFIGKIILFSIDKEDDEYCLYCFGYDTVRNDSE
ncbi:MAG: hypothetical protein FWG69_03725 [Oscillospiraceae bacterium]|nr:hypothetical protein [Oscillospiraceae bacterium]